MHIYIYTYLFGPKVGMIYLLGALRQEGLCTHIRAACEKFGVS